MCKTSINNDNMCCEYFFYFILINYFFKTNHIFLLEVEVIRRTGVDKQYYICFQIVSRMALIDFFLISWYIFDYVLCNRVSTYNFFWAHVLYIHIYGLESTLMFYLKELNKHATQRFDIKSHVNYKYYVVRNI